MIPLNTILVHSIGSGHDSFYQVVKTTPKSVTVRELEDRIVKRSVKWQTMDIRPKVGCFRSDSEPQLLRVKLDRFGELQIGPVKRMIWWSVYDGKTRHQFSS